MFEFNPQFFSLREDRTQYGVLRMMFSQAYGKVIIHPTVMGDKLIFTRHIVIGDSLAEYTSDEIIKHLETNWQKVFKLLTLWDEAYFRMLKREDDTKMNKKPFYMALQHCIAPTEKEILNGITFTFARDSIIMEDADFRATWTPNDNIVLDIKEQGIHVALSYKADKFDATVALNDYEKRLNDCLLNQIQKLIQEVHQLATKENIRVGKLEAYSFSNGGFFRAEHGEYHWGTNCFPNANQIFHEFKRWWK